MSLLTVPILGVPISTLDMEESLSLCAQRARRNEGGYVCFANVHTVTESLENASLRAALEGAFLAAADGMPLVWASRFKKSPIRSRVCGPDFMKAFLKNYPDVRVGFIGGAPGQAENLARLYAPNAPCVTPPMRPFASEFAREDWQQLLSQIPDGQMPQVIWIGLGAPKQELYMASLSRDVTQVLFMGVGAAFDFLTNTKRRAPLWMQRTGLEWLFRLFQEPRRLWKRYAVTNLRFLFALAQETIRATKT